MKPVSLGRRIALPKVLAPQPAGNQTQQVGGSFPLRVSDHSEPDTGKTAWMRFISREVGNPDIIRKRDAMLEVPALKRQEV